MLPMSETYPLPLFLLTSHRRSGHQANTARAPAEATQKLSIFTSASSYTKAIPIMAGCCYKHSDNYQPSDMAWMDMKTNDVELVFGAIENYEDQHVCTFTTYVVIFESSKYS